MQRLLIVGCGDVAWRALPQLLRRYRVFALLRDVDQCVRWRQAGAVPLIGDLDRPETLGRLAGLAQHILHLAPPPDRGLRDSRTRHLVAALGRASGKNSRKSLPRLPSALTYISTTGVYGDQGGALIDETARRRPLSPRGQRRADAEQYLRDWARRSGVRVSILRAPGIYASDRLPLARLQAGTPALVAEDDVQTNHIHADDLAGLCAASLLRGRSNRCYNASDDSCLKMGEYFDQVADAFALPRPPRLSREEAGRVLSPVQLSFMSESRRLLNRRIKTELRYRLRYPRVDDGIAAALQEQLHADA
ncbi:NAD-dependent epimerase/dehydratase family protein [Azospira sp. I13]|uniref:NAD-dependent epimerase/dehydratase family protein n=1 Tax=Azospira sp. I13 TaxID=1765050 RepID=UPI000D58DA11|nr:NAD-dependent epimerase/dehydratase family protein [Azospira sp. I13]